MRFPLFVDSRYHEEQDVEFDPADVESLGETKRGLFLGGSRDVTIVTLCDRRQYTLNGHFQVQIEQARRH